MPAVDNNVGSPGTDRENKLYINKHIYSLIESVQHALIPPFPLIIYSIPLSQRCTFGQFNKCFRLFDLSFPFNNPIENGASAATTLTHRTNIYICVYYFSLFFPLSLSSK